jgi:hypothetical protein
MQRWVCLNFSFSAAFCLLAVCCRFVGKPGLGPQQGYLIVVSEKKSGKNECFGLGMS